MATLAETYRAYVEICDHQDRLLQALVEMRDLAATHEATLEQWEEADAKYRAIAAEAPSLQARHAKAMASWRQAFPT